MGGEHLSHEIVNAVQLNAKLHDALIRERFGAVHAHLVVQLEHDISIGYACCRQAVVGALFACH